MTEKQKQKQKPIQKLVSRHDYCNTCYFKHNDQNPKILFNECTLCYLNAQAVKTNNYKPLPTAKKLA